MTDFIVSGATGFIGSRFVRQLLETDPEHRVYALVRPASIPRFATRTAGWTGRDRLITVAADLAQPGLGLSDGALPDTVEHVVHLGAIYDMDAGAEEQLRVNVLGTERMIDIAESTGALMHHVSSIAVSGDHRGRFTEHDFDKGQGFPTPYHQTKFAAEERVRSRPGLRWRVYRPAIVLGDSRNGEMDKVDGPYYMFKYFRLASKLPQRVPLPLPDLGQLNAVPVDFVVDALTALVTYDPEAENRVFHLVDPKYRNTTDFYNALAPALCAPHAVDALPPSVGRTALEILGREPLRSLRDGIARREGIPPAVLDTVSLPAHFTTGETFATLGRLGVELPEITEYGPRLWDYWARHLDPARHRRDPRQGLQGINILITGASSGIGAATARECVARGATVFMLARDVETLSLRRTQIAGTEPVDTRIGRGRAYAYPCDITDAGAVTEVVDDILDAHGRIDVVVNNAGVSIRRSARLSLARSRDLRRTMEVNYFGALNVIDAVVDHFRANGGGHVVNVSSIGVGVHAPRFGAYLASKAALETFTDVAASELRSDDITFTTIRMPLTRTPMIEPTSAYENARAMSTDKAAAIVLRAIIERPVLIDTPLGTWARLARFAAPGLNRQARNLGYHITFDPAADRDTAAAPQPSRAHKVLHRTRHTLGAKVRPMYRAASRSPLRRYSRRVANAVPGITW
ncbi:SDR family oxidoreductase [Gordonia aurantiaca]|uniref:SDR family oxidoreductase n=1 Tax=Gordonia sp. B21 TaxID=3151852 RepID=UPI003263225B